MRRSLPANLRRRGGEKSEQPRLDYPRPQAGVPVTETVRLLRRRLWMWTKR
jgi:hypothetical protein